MKNKNLMIISVIVIFMALVVGFLVINENTKDKNCKCENGTLKAKEITNERESSLTIPDFTVLLDGSYEGTITGADLREREVKLYDFDAGIDTVWGVVDAHLTGVKLKEVLKAMGVENFKEVAFVGSSYRSVNYLIDQLEDAYLVFYNDAETLDKSTQVSLIVPTYAYRYSLEDISKMTFVSDMIEPEE